MLQARTQTVQIARSVAEIYEFLVAPSNLAQWTTVEQGRPEPDQGEQVWSFEGVQGRVTARFTPPNDFHVLDYTLELGGRVTHAAYVRLIPNGEHTVLTHTSVQQPAVSDELFASEAEWLMSDLLVLKTLMESE